MDFSCKRLVPYFSEKPQRSPQGCRKWSRLLLNYVKGEAPTVLDTDELTRWNLTNSLLFDGKLSYIKPWGKEQHVGTFCRRQIRKHWCKFRSPYLLARHMVGSVEWPNQDRTWTSWLLWQFRVLSWEFCFFFTRYIVESSSLHKRE